MQTRFVCAGAAVVALALGGSLLTVSVVSAATDTAATWTGLTPTGAGATNWSSVANWSATGGNSVPHTGDTVNTLNFPVLTGCTGDACYTSVDDFTALSVGQLDIDDAAPYVITGANAITLTGGLTASTTDTTNNVSAFNVPITLGGSQTWSVTGSGPSAFSRSVAT
jgi:hypothetical protein